MAAINQATYTKGIVVIFTCAILKYIFEKKYAKDSGNNGSMYLITVTQEMVVFNTIVTALVLNQIECWHSKGVEWKSWIGLEFVLSKHKSCGLFLASLFQKLPND